VSDDICPCFHFDLASYDADQQWCECGHAEDEHDESGECQAEDVEATGDDR
jgi:ferredoxin-thioredoxin reductase catalytic subunit